MNGSERRRCRACEKVLAVLRGVWIHVVTGAADCPGGEGVATPLRVNG